jgi:hypothetical protein
VKRGYTYEILVVKSEEGDQLGGLGLNGRNLLLLLLLLFLVG